MSVRRYTGRAAALWLMLASVAGCRTEVSLGSPLTPDAGFGGARARSTEFGECGYPPGALASEAQWSGSPASGALTRVRLTLPSEDTPGWVVFGGNVTMPAPLPDELCYPDCNLGESANGSIPRWHEGVRYALSLSGEDEGALVATVDLNAPWEAWCEMRTPEPQGDGSYGCASAELSERLTATCRGAPSGGTQASCCLLRLCDAERVCECDADTCRVRPLRTQVTLHLADDDVFFFDETGGILARLTRS